MSLKADTNLTETSEMENGMSKSFPQEEIQQYYEGKFTSMVVYEGMSFSRKRWCCATGVKLGTCFTKIVLRLHTPLKILLCLSLSRVVNLHHIKILYNLFLLQRITLVVNSRDNILLRRRMRTGRLLLLRGLLRIWSDSESCSDSDSQNESGS